MTRIIQLFLILFSTVVYAGSNDDEYKTFFGAGVDSEDDFSFQIYQHQIDLRQVSLPICADQHVDIKRCEPSACRALTSFGKILSKVKGIKDGKCEYVERTPGVDGANCEFPQENLTRIHELFEKRFDKLGGIAIEFSEQEINELESIFKNHCVFVKDYSQRKEVSIDAAKPGDDVDPEFLVSDFDKYANIVKVVEDLQNKEKDGYDDLSDPLDGYKSIMFSKRDIDLVNLILEATYTGRGAPSSAVFGRNSLGNFYLGSILYYTADKWSVWVNDKRYSNDTSNDVLVIESVSPDRVRVTWSAGDLDKISPSWRGKLVAAGGKYVSKEYDIVVKGKEEHMQVTFSLKPNQTFDITSMSIFEGKIN